MLGQQQTGANLLECVIRSVSVFLEKTHSCAALEQRVVALEFLSFSFLKSYTLEIQRDVILVVLEFPVIKKRVLQMLFCLHHCL